MGSGLSGDALFVIITTGWATALRNAVEHQFGSVLAFLPTDQGKACFGSLGEDLANV